MLPGDLVAVILTGSGIGSLQQFTGNKQILHAAIDRIRFNVSGRVGASSYTQVSAISALSLYLEEERSRGLVLGTLGAIRYVINGMEALAGRKNLILFSESLVMNFDSYEVSDAGAVFSMNLSDSTKDRIHSLLQDANRAAVVIHTIDPRGGSWGAYMDVSSADIAISREGLAFMAQKTGGLFLQHHNFVDVALQEATKDGEIYYLIGYQPDATTIAEMQGDKPKYHNIEIRVKRRGVHVRSRSGFFTVPEDQYEPPTRRDRMIQALQSAFCFR